MYIMTIFHDEIVPLPLSKFRETFNNTNRNIEKSHMHSERPKWAKENGKHYIYFHGRSASGKGCHVVQKHKSNDFHFGSKDFISLFFSISQFDFCSFPTNILLLFIVLSCSIKSRGLPMLQGVPQYCFHFVFVIFSGSRAHTEELFIAIGQPTKF